MPLRSGSSPEAFKQNLSTLMGEVGKSPHVQSRQQALAIAYSKQRQGRQTGGGVGMDLHNPSPFFGGPAGSLRPYWSKKREAGEDEYKMSPRELRERGYQGGGIVGGLVNHDEDPELPQARDHAQLVDMLNRYEEPAYLATIRRLLEGQQRLNAMHPVQREQLRRYWLGGLAYWMGGLVGKGR